MGKNRLEAFSDGVIAIIITIMVLELKVPHGAAMDVLLPLWPVLLSYLLSFIYVGIYWNNHHHMLHAVDHVSGRALWANLHLLFWLSLIPFVSGWMGENHFATFPVVAYGFVLLMCGLAYTILAHCLAHGEHGNATLADAIGKDWKGRISVLSYFAAIALSFFDSMYGCAIYVGVALLWLIPDTRIEKRLQG